MTDQDIIQALIDRDERVTQQFFFKSCRPLFTSIIRHVFSYEVDYDEFVSEFYLHLMENDAHRLRQFEGRSTIYQSQPSATSSPSANASSTWRPAAKSNKKRSCKRRKWTANRP